MCVSVWCFTATPSVSAAAAEAGVPVTSGPPASVVASVSPAVALEVAEASSHAPSSSSGHSSPLVQPIIVNPMEEGESGAVWLAGGSCPFLFHQCRLFFLETEPCEVVCVCACFGALWSLFLGTVMLGLWSAPSCLDVNVLLSFGAGKPCPLSAVFCLCFLTVWAFAIKNVRIITVNQIPALKKKRKESVQLSLIQRLSSKTSKRQMDT